MKGFASDTSVPVGRTQEEIRKTLEKYGATGFMFGQGSGNAMVLFEMKNRRVKFILPLPKVNDKKGQQLERARWRCLLLAIKAKLECVFSGISTFENEFMGMIVMPDGKTVSETITPHIENAYSTGRMVPLLGPGVGS